MARKRGPGRPPGKSEVNKAKLIRDYKEANPTKKPAEIAEELNQQHNLQMSSAYVSNVLSTSRKKRRRRRRKQAEEGAVATASASRNAAPKFSRKSLLDAKRMAKEMGGISSAKAALDLLSELSD